MNSSLLVPALIVVAVTAGIFVFGESLFPGSDSEPVNEYVVGQSKAEQSDEVKPTATGSDFSWDETSVDVAQSPIKTSTESFVSTKPSEEAPGALYGLDDDVQADETFGSADDLTSSALGSSSDSTDMNVDDFEQALDLATSSKQVDDDLNDFFNKPSGTTTSESSAARSSVSKSFQKSPAPKPKTVDRSESEVAMAAPNNSGSNNDVFDNFGSDLSDFSPAPTTDVDEEMKSVVMAEAKKATPKQFDVAASEDDASSVISGALEPVKDSNNQPAVVGTNIEANAPVRKFKITNPKETTLPVTMSVDGKR